MREGKKGDEYTGQRVGVRAEIGLLTALTDVDVMGGGNDSR